MQEAKTDSSKYALSKCKKQSHTRLLSANYSSECSVKSVHSWKSLLKHITELRLQDFHAAGPAGMCPQQSPRQDIYLAQALRLKEQKNKKEIKRKQTAVKSIFKYMQVLLVFRFYI